MTTDNLIDLIDSTDNDSIAACAFVVLRRYDEAAALDLPDADRLYGVARDEGITLDVAEATVARALAAR